MEIANAKIDRTFLGIEDHGIFTFILYLDYGGSGQGYGTHALDNFDKKLEARVGTAFGCEFIMQVLQTVGVYSWEELKGKHIRVKRDDFKIYAIAHILKNNWLDAEELVKKFS
jgi:hypothetical protein